MLGVCLLVTSRSYNFLISFNYQRVAHSKLYVDIYQVCSQVEVVVGREVVKVYRRKRGEYETFPHFSLPYYIPYFQLDKLMFCAKHTHIRLLFPSRPSTVKVFQFKSFLNEIRDLPLLTTVQTSQPDSLAINSLALASF